MEEQIVIVKKRTNQTKNLGGLEKSSAISLTSSSDSEEDDSDYIVKGVSDSDNSYLSSSSNQYYEIEKLLDKRINPITGVVEYLVKWEGYSNDENTWEPETRLVEDDNADLIKEWRQAQAMKSPELRAAKITLLSKLRARHVTPTLGRPLKGDNFVLSENHGWENVLNGKDEVIEDHKDFVDNNNESKEEPDVFTLNEAGNARGIPKQNELLKNATSDVSRNSSSSTVDDDEEDEDDDDDLRIVFQTQQDEIFPQAQEIDNNEKPFPLPGSSIKHTRRLHPEEFCTPKYNGKQKAMDVMSILSNDSSNSSSNSNIRSVSSQDKTNDNIINNKMMKKTSPLLSSMIKFSPSKVKPTLKRKFMGNRRDSSGKKQKTLLFSQSSKVLLKDKSPLREQGKMRNSFLGMRNKKNTKSFYSKSLFGRR